MTMLKRNENIDLLRGFAAICMILGHSFIVYPIDISNVPWCFSIGRIIYTFHMELFFIVSGWVCRYHSYVKFVKNKIQRLVLPYLVFGLSFLLVQAFGGSTVNGNASFSENIIKLLLHGGGYWFIYVLFLVFAIYPVFGRFCNTRLATATAIFVGLLLNEVFVFPNTFCIRTVIHYFPYFLLGTLLGKCNLVQYDAKIRCHWFLLALLCGLLYWGIDFLLLHSMLSALEYTLSFVRATVFCAMLYALCFGPIPGFLKNIVFNTSRFSLQLYLFNGYFLTALRILVCNILHIESPIIIVLSIWLGNIAISLFICKVILPRSSLLQRICGMPHTTISSQSAVQCTH